MSSCINKKTVHKAESEMSPSDFQNIWDSHQPGSYSVEQQGPKMSPQDNISGFESSKINHLNCPVEK